MPTSYPNGIDSFSDKQNNVDWVEAADINNLQDAVEAIETVLGTQPNSTYGNVREFIESRLDSQNLSLTGDLNFNLYEALNVVVEHVATLPSWTSDDEGRLVYCENDNMLYIGNDSDWINTVTGYVGTNGVTISGSNISLDSTVVRTSGNQSIAGEKTFTANEIIIGDGTANSHKVIVAYVSGSNDPEIRYNKDNSNWEYSDNGTDYYDIQNSAGDGISVTGDEISVDSTVLRTTGSQSITGVKTVTAEPTSTGLTGASFIINPSTADIDELLLGAGLSSDLKFSVDKDGTCYVKNQLEIDSDLILSQVRSDFLGTSNKVEITGHPGIGLSSSSLLVNPSMAAEDSKLLTLANNSSEMFSVSECGDVSIKGFTEMDISDTLESGDTVLTMNVPSNVSGSMFLDCQVNSSSRVSIDTFGRTKILGIPDTGLANSALLVNPPSSPEESYLLMLADDDSEVFSVNNLGDVTIRGFAVIDADENLEADDAAFVISVPGGSSSSMLIEAEVNSSSVFSVDINGYVEGNLRCANSGSGAPSGGSDGDIYIDTTNNRLYVKVSGSWKYSALT